MPTKPKRDAKVVLITPTSEHPLPYVTDDERDPPGTPFLDKLSATASTAEALDALGADISVDPTTAREEASALREAVRTRSITPLKNHPAAAKAAMAFLTNYGASLALDVAQVRTALTNKLLELAGCGDPRHELRAIELLGKHSDIGLFTERSEININYTTSDGLEQAIKERVKRLLNATDLDKRPLGADLDEELGIIPGEYDDVEPEAPPDTPDEEGAPEPDQLPTPAWDDEDDPDTADDWEDERWSGV